MTDKLILNSGLSFADGFASALSIGGYGIGELVHRNNSSMSADDGYQLDGMRMNSDFGRIGSDISDAISMTMKK